ncbi:MAG: hypothetical protein U0804_17095 [Gemmataceae bacterium]
MTPTTPTTTAPPLFEGTLSIETDVLAGPLLFVSFRCGSCRRRHHHRWNLAEDGAEDWAPHGRQPHCDRPDLFPTGYLVVPADTTANHNTYARFAGMVERHRRESRGAARQAARRAAGAAAG